MTKKDFAEKLKTKIEKEIEKITKLAKKRSDAKDVWMLEAYSIVLKMIDDRERED